MSDDLVDVQLIGLPVPVHHRASTHMKALQREFDLIRQRERDITTIPHRLLELIAELDDEFGGVGEQPVDELEDAVDRGATSIDLTYRIPASAGPASERLGELLDEADDYCRSGTHLLTLVTPPDALRYRKWFLAEFVRQTTGLPPVPWTEYRADEPHQGSSPAGQVGDIGGLGDLPLGWSMDHGNDVAVLSVSGPVDLVSSPMLRDALAPLIAEHRRVVVDLSGCDFLDSVGVSVLIAAHLRAVEHDVGLSFRMSASARRVIDITGLADRLTIEN